MKRERAAAISAVGLMLIAGCSGGRSAGTTGPSLPGGGQQPGSTLVNGARATLQIMLQPKTPQGSASGRRAFGTRPGATATRHPAWVSPSSAYVSLQVVPTNGGPTYATSFALSTCSVGTNASGEYYNCALSVPYGSDVFYVSMYDASGYLLSTNQFASPAPQMVYPNGSASANYISVYEQGVVARITQESPVFCFAAGHPQQIPILIVDADGNDIYGPLANPITPTFTAYDGAGLGAISVYAYYSGSLYATPVNNQTLYDTSVYASPFFYVSGREGAITISATVANIPVYAYGTYATYTPYGGIAATGTYIAWGVNSANSYGGDLYPIAVQTTLNPHQAVPCQSANLNSGPFLYVGSILSSGYPYVVAADTNNTVHIFDASVTADFGHAYTFLQTSSSYGRPGLQSLLYDTSDFQTTSPFVDFFTSTVTNGRIDVLSSNCIYLVDTSSGLIMSYQFYPTAVAMTGATRLAGSTVSQVLYYDEPGTPNLHGILTSYYGGTTLIAAVGYINGQIYSLAPSGSGGTYIFVRGANTTGSYYLCEFDSQAYTGVYCHGTSSSNSSVASMTFDPGSGVVMWSGGYTGATSTVYALPANQAPSVFTASNPFTSAPFYTLQSATFRFTPTTGTPGIVGLYGGPQTTGPCAGTGEVTWLSYAGGSFTYIASLCWPNHYVALTYP